MKFKIVTACALAAVIALSVPSSAWAHDRWGRGGGRGGFGGPVRGLFDLGAAVIDGTVAIVTAPFYAVGAFAQPAYGPASGYYGAQNQAYYQAPAYADPRVVYPAPPVYYPRYYPMPPPPYYRPY